MKVSGTDDRFNGKQNALLHASAPSGFGIQLTHVQKWYGGGKRGKQALRDVNLSIPPGVFGLLGRNGAGKTTLLQTIATLLPPTTGDIQIGPYDAIRQRWHVRSLLGFLPQDQGFYPRFTVEETLRYLAALQGLEHAEKQIAHVLEAVNLSDRRKARVGTLSGGMRRRVGLAQALLGNPPILIIDEPTAGLDPVEQQRFRTLLGALGAQGNRTIVLSTHIVTDVATVANQLAVLEEGTVAFQGSVSALTAKAQDRCWLWRTTLGRIDALRQSTSLLVSSLTPISDKAVPPDQVMARIIGECPSDEAVLCDPTLEDGYFSIIGPNEVRDNVSFSA